MKKAIGDENGKILILVLVLLVVGGLVLAPLLGLMSTGLAAGRVYEKKADELYAADAGVEDGVWQISPRRDAEAGYTTGPRVPADPGPGDWYWLADPINGKGVKVRIDMLTGCLGAGIYRVTSVGTGVDGSDTEIQAYTQTYPLMWGNAITSTADVTLQPNVGVYGDVVGNVIKGEEQIYDGEIHDPYPEDDWPKWQDFREYYDCLGLAKLVVDCKNQLIVENEVPSGFHEGNLEIIGDGEARLTGPVYIRGDDAAVLMTKGDWVLDLNYQTIYVQGRNHDLSTNKYALQIGRGSPGNPNIGVSLTGSGSIIAEGNIRFYPNIVAGENEGNEDQHFIFVMSLVGKVDFLPRGTFYGSVAGLEVYVSPDVTEETIIYTEPPIEDGQMLVNFPFDMMRWAVNLMTWEIK